MDHQPGRRPARRHRADDRRMLAFRVFAGVLIQLEGFDVDGYGGLPAAHFLDDGRETLRRLVFRINRRPIRMCADFTLATSLRFEWEPGCATTTGTSNNQTTLE